MRRSEPPALVGTSGDGAHEGIVTRAAPTAPTTSARTAVVAGGLAVMLALLLTAFAWPASRSRLRDVPVAITGPTGAVDEVAATLEAKAPGAFDLRHAPNAATARRSVADRDVEGAIILGATGPEVIVATQGSPALAQAITQLGWSLAAGGALAVDDVAPAPPGDPRGAGLAAGALPLALASAIGGVALVTLVRGLHRQVAGSLLFAALGSLAAVGVLHGWLSALDGSWLAEAGVVALGLAAVTLALTGANALAGHAALAVVELTIVVLGNPLSAASTAPSMLPDGWQQLGQALPPGAMVTALRAVSGFGGIGVGAPLAVLAVWALGGVAALVVAAR